MARLGDVCIINPKVPPIDDSMLVSFVPMQRVGEEGEFDPSELRTYADVKKDSPILRMLMYCLLRSHLAWKTAKAQLHVV